MMLDIYETMTKLETKDDCKDFCNYRSSCLSKAYCDFAKQAMTIEEVAHVIAVRVWMMYIRQRNIHEEEILAVLRKITSLPSNITQFHGEFNYLLSYMYKLEPYSYYPVTAEEIYQDILALKKQYTIFYERESQGPALLKITTPEIQIGDYNFGEFEVVYPLYRYNPLSVIPVYCYAVNPLYNELYDCTHPHICSDRLCLGSGQDRITHIRTQGYILAFFDVILSILRTYSPGQAHAQLESWDNSDVFYCTDCDSVIAGSDEIICNLCKDVFCSTCLIGCNSCNNIFCYQCGKLCNQCDNWFCPDCFENHHCKGDEDYES
jgi:hypothetical protein